MSQIIGDEVLYYYMRGYCKYESLAQPNERNATKPMVFLYRDSRKNIFVDRSLGYSSNSRQSPKCLFIC